MELTLTQIKTKKSFWIITRTYNEGGFPIENYSVVATTEEIAFQYANNLIKIELEGNFNKTYNAYEELKKYKEAKLTNKYTDKEWVFISIEEKKYIIGESE